MWSLAHFRPYCPFSLFSALPSPFSSGWHYSGWLPSLRLAFAPSTFMTSGGRGRSPCVFPAVIAASSCDGHATVLHFHARGCIVVCISPVSLRWLGWLFHVFVHSLLSVWCLFRVIWRLLASGLGTFVSGPGPSLRGGGASRGDVCTSGARHNCPVHSVLRGVSSLPLSLSWLVVGAVSSLFIPLFSCFRYPFPLMVHPPLCMRFCSFALGLFVSFVDM